MGDWFSKMKEMLRAGKGGEGAGNWGKLLMLAVCGAVIMLLPSMFDAGPHKSFLDTKPQQSGDQPVFLNKEKGESSLEDMEETYEQQLTSILAEISGVGDVSVMVTLDSTEEIVVEKDKNERTHTTKEVDKEKATRDITDHTRDEKVVLIKGEQGDHPVILKRLKPTVRGVLVVAKGGDNLKVKANITEAVQRALRVEPHKISILPKK